MNSVQSFISENCSFLFSDYGARVVESHSPGRETWVVLRLLDLKLQFVLDDRQLALEFQSARDPDTRRWHSLDMVRQMLTGQFRGEEEMDSENIAFLKSRLDDIIDAFSPAKYEATLAKLRECEEARADRLFGPIKKQEKPRD